MCVRACVLQSVKEVHALMQRCATSFGVVLRIARESSTLPSPPGTTDADDDHSMTLEQALSPAALVFSPKPDPNTTDMALPHLAFARALTSSPMKLTPRERSPTVLPSRIRTEQRSISPVAVASEVRRVL